MHMFEYPDDNKRGWAQQSLDNFGFFGCSMIQKQRFYFSQKARLTIYVFMILASVLRTATCKQFLCMLNPIACSEKQETEQSTKAVETDTCVEELQSLLQTKSDDIKVILSHPPEETISTQQTASFANWAAVDLFISIHTYKETNNKPTLNIYYLVCDPVLDFLPHHFESTQFIPLYSAHYQSITSSKNYAAALAESLQQKTDNPTLNTQGPFGIPLTSLLGIRYPAITLEFGITHDSQWRALLPEVAEALAQVISTHIKSS